MSRIIIAERKTCEIRKRKESRTFRKKYRASVFAIALTKTVPTAFLFSGYCSRVLKKIESIENRRECLNTRPKRSITRGNETRKQWNEEGWMKDDSLMDELDDSTQREEILLTGWKIACKRGLTREAKSHRVGFLLPWNRSNRQRATSNSHSRGYQSD